MLGNLTNFDRAELALALEPLYAAKAKERQVTSTGGARPQLRENSHEAGKGRTDESLAEIADISSNTLLLKNERKQCRQNWRYRGPSKFGLSNRLKSEPVAMGPNLDGSA